jgi:hypothetical protein
MNVVDWYHRLIHHTEAEMATEIPRTFSIMSGMVRHPRVRDLTERFESTVLPLFRRWTQEVGTLLPELYGHELSTGDFGRRHAACEARARCSRRARFNDSLRS